MDIRSRLKNYGLWVAVIAFIPIFLQSFGFNILPVNYSEVATSLLGIFVLLGIVNNPSTENKGIADDTQKTIAK